MADKIINGSLEIKLKENSTLTIKDHNENTLCSIDEATGNISGVGATAAEIQDAWAVWPIKGQKILIDIDGNGAKPFRVLSINGNKIAKLFSLYDYLGAPCNYAISPYATDTFSDGATRTSYKQSLIKDSLNTYYNTFTTKVKAAIQDTHIIQTTWQSIEGHPTPTAEDYGLAWRTYNRWKKVDSTLDCGNHKLFALSLDELWEYLGAEPGDTVPETQRAEYNALFQPDSSVDYWGSSAVKYSTLSGYVVALRQHSSYDYPMDKAASNTQHRGTLRFAMNIDLRQVEFSIVEEE